MDKKKLKADIIKGNFLSLDGAFFWMVFALVLGLICFYKVLSNEFTAPLELNEAIWETIGFLFISIVMYWIASSHYYFYGLMQEKIVVKNFMRKYKKEFYYNRILKVNLYGNLTMSRILTNGIEFIYSESDKVKHYKYHSKNLRSEDWETLIKKLNQLGIIYDDPNKEFFRNSGIVI